MLSDDVIEKVIDRLTDRIERANLYILKEIGRSIDKIGTFNPSKANQLIQIMKNGGDYQRIVKNLSKITKLNQKEITKIFDEVAKKDYRFSKEFYEYRNKPFIPYEDTPLKKQVDIIAKRTLNDYYNLTKTTSFGFGLPTKNGIEFKGLRSAYYSILDEAVLSISQGKETFESAMYRKMKEVAQSGLKVVYPTTYIGKDGKEHHYTRRLDSAVRMNIKSALRQMHNETQEIIGKEIDADGIEISVHDNPAPDHQDAQGKQFSNKEFKRLQETGIGRTYDNELINMQRGAHFRPISEWNCYHYIFSIILGVNPPQYTKTALNDIKKNNNKGFVLDGKHYTNYQGTQLQRQIETEIRRTKEQLEMSNNELLKSDARLKLRLLNNKYRRLNQISGLRAKPGRLRIK